MIPSPRDALADPEMPQAPLDDRLLEGLDPAGVLSMPNPCLLAWLPPNDGDRSLVIGAVTADVVKHLGEICHAKHGATLLLSASLGYVRLPLAALSLRQRLRKRRH